MEGAKDNKLMSMHRLSPTPMSSADEGAESGDDSEEDIVTNYLPATATAATTAREEHASPPHHHHLHHHHHHHHHHQQQPPPQKQRNQPQQQQPQQPQPQQQVVVASVHPAHAHGPPRRLVRMAEIPTMDSITAESLGMGVGVGPTDAFIPPIPTISITPHSPIAHKPFTVLDENIRQLQGIQETIQRMRETNLVVKMPNLGRVYLAGRRTPTPRTPRLRRGPPTPTATHTPTTRSTSTTHTPTTRTTSTTRTRTPRTSTTTTRATTCTSARSTRRRATKATGLTLITTGAPATPTATRRITLTTLTTTNRPLTALRIIPRANSSSSSKSPLTQATTTMPSAVTGGG